MTDKVEVGNDEFCSNCMEWREYDEEGRCKVCKKIIKKQKSPIPKNSYNEYIYETFEDEDIDE